MKKNRKKNLLKADWSRPRAIIDGYFLDSCIQAIPNIENGGMIPKRDNYDDGIFCEFHLIFGIIRHEITQIHFCREILYMK